MSHYIHHIPGRLRIQSASFRCQADATQQAQDRILAMDGVNHVRLNPRAGSLTVQYDPARLTRGELMDILGDIGCLPSSTRATASDMPLAGKAGALFGKALAGALVNKVVERSAFKLVSVLL
jgi:hypothetical protein